MRASGSLHALAQATSASPAQTPSSLLSPQHVPQPRTGHTTLKSSHIPRMNSAMGVYYFLHFLDWNIEVHRTKELIPVLMVQIKQSDV